MPQYKYKARDDKGNLLENVASAETLNELRLHLKEKNLYLIDAEDVFKTIFCSYQCGCCYDESVDYSFRAIREL